MQRLVGWLLLLYPRALRREHKTELLEFIELERRDTTTGRLSSLIFWTGTVVDLLRGAARARLRERRKLPPVERSSGVIADIRQSFRSLRASPLVTGIIVLTLALGIGLNTAIFSAVRAVLWAPLPYDGPDRLVYLGAQWVTDDVRFASHAGKDFDIIRRNARSFADVAAVTDIRQNLTGIEPPAQVQVGWASRNLFEVLGIEPQIGPGFTEDAPPGTAVLSHHLWQRDFGGDLDVVGRVVRLDDYPCTIAGVLPEGFQLHLPDSRSASTSGKCPMTGGKTATSGAPKVSSSCFWI
jgi:putative ABC transport system permease protein